MTPDAPPPPPEGPPPEGPIPADRSPALRWLPAAKARLRGWRRRWRRLRPLGEDPAAQAAWLVARRVVVAVIGSTIVALGLVMVIAPGPALVVVPLGLFVLGFEFAWALRLQRRILAGATDAAGVAKRWGRGVTGRRPGDAGD